MPVVPGPTPVPPQVNQNQVAPTTQFNYRELVGRLMQWNPEMDYTVAQSFISNSYRRIIDSRNWYGTLVKGQVTVPNAYSTGIATVTNASTTVTVTGASFTNSFIGRQFRVGFAQPIYTIIEVTGAETIILDLPWGGNTQTGVGYQIFQNIINLGFNVKRVLAMVNQAQGYRLKLGMPQEVLNIYDTWRTQTGWTYMLVAYVPSQHGFPQWELYPAPTFQQSFPFMAFIQPPDMVNDEDYPASWIRSDIILYGALVDALMFQGKKNPYYDPMAAQFYNARYTMELDKMAKNDDAQYPQDLMWEFERYPFTQYGANYWQSHDESAPWA